MTRIPMKAALATAAFGALLGGCATTIEAGPGYYHYDTGIAHPSAPPVVYQEPGVTYREAPGAYNNPPIVVYDQPRLPYRSERSAFTYQEHGQ
jgi:hypothetical protein